MNVERRRVVLAIDPGRSRIGVAVCERGTVRSRAVVAPEALTGLVRDWMVRHGVTEIVVGNRTGSDAVVASLAGLTGASVRRIDETGTTLRARARYFADHPPRGWRRLVPRTLQIPPEPYDDYAAVLLGEAALEKGLSSPGG